MRVLLVEDNPKLAGAIRQGLGDHGHMVETCMSGFEAEDEALGSEFDLLILDVMLPDRDGRDLCRALRHRGLTTPILMLTALSGTTDKVSGLDAGADDYLSKPFEFEELVARVRALLRRGRATEASKLTCDDLHLDLAKRTATRAGRPIKLSAKEFALVEYLMRNQDRVLSRNSIAEKVWEMPYEPSSNVIDVYISSLRRKIDRGHRRPLIHTVIGSGYRFGVMEEAEVSA